MKKFNQNTKFRKRESSRYNDEEPRYERREDRPQRSPSRFGRGEDRPEGRSPSRFGRREHGRTSYDKQMFRTTCDKCGERCEVPFKPTEGKPVYCSNCFRKNESSDTRRPDNNQKEFDQINEKLDKIMQTMGIH